jgi:acyl dehydratase
MALWLEDFTPGREFQTGGRTVSDADIAAFAEVSGDRNPLHLDDAYAAATPFHGRIAHGALGIAIATGLLSQLGLTAGTLVALVGIDWRFTAPVRPGDTLTLRLQVSEARARDGSRQGLVKLAAQLVNQRQETVQEGVITEMIRTRPRV